MNNKQLNNLRKLIIPTIIILLLSVSPKTVSYAIVFESDDPVQISKDFIEEYSIFFNPTGRALLKSQFTIGFSLARYGGRYLLLESPYLVVNLARGGVYDVVGEITYEGVLDIIKRAVNTPDKLSESVAYTMIKEGMREYDIAYSIARKYIKTGELSREDAIKFLWNRWGLLKLPQAQGLYLDSQEEYSVNNQMAERTMSELLNKFETEYKSKLGINNSLPLIDAALFIKDLREIIESKKIGLADYPPYQRFEERIEEINRRRLNEMEILGIDSSGSIIVREVILEIRSDDGRKSAHISYPQLQGLTNELIQEKVNKVLKSDFTSGWEFAKSNVSDSNFPSQYEYDVSYDVSVLDYNILSLIQKGYNFDGGAHGQSWRVSHNIHLENGNFYNSNDFFVPNYESLLKKILIDKLLALSYSMNRDYYESAIRINQDQIYYLDDSNLIIYFGPYTIHGNQSEEIRIPFSEIREIINPSGPIAYLYEVEENEAGLNSNSLRESKDYLPLKIVNYFKEVNFVDPCSNSSRLPEMYYRIDLNNDGEEEYLFWFVGCPETRGQGTVYIFSGTSHKCLLEYSGYEITGPAEIKLVYPVMGFDNKYNFYHKIKFGRLMFYFELGENYYHILGYED